MEERVEHRVGERPRPVVLVRRPVEVLVVEEAAVDLHQQGVRAGDAEVVAVVLVGRPGRQSRGPRS